MSNNCMFNDLINISCFTMSMKLKKTRLISIESQPNKVVVVVVFVVVGLVVVVGVVVVIVGYRNLTLEFGQNQVNNS